MSISLDFARSNPRIRVFYADGVYKCIAALCLGASGNLLAKYKDKSKMKSILRDTTRVPDIKSATVIFTFETFLESYKANIAGLVGLFAMKNIMFENIYTAAPINRYIYDKCGLTNVINDELLSNTFCINTLCFKDRWVNAFKTITQKTFFGTKPTIMPMMRQVNNILCYVDSTIQAVKLPFANGAYAEFVMGLPIRQEIGTINYRQQRITLELPKFDHTDILDLKPLLMAAGMQDLFTSGNLTNISGDSALFVKYIFQIVLCSFDERGINASNSVDLTTLNISFNKPFHYCIKKNNNTIVSGYYDTN